MNFFAKKSLGQNFLHAPHVLSMMTHVMDKGDDFPVLEVGPGKGALTAELLSHKLKVFAVEKDDRAIPFLRERFYKEIGEGQLILIHKDILLMSDDDLISLGLIQDKYRIAGNLPYYITGAFMRKFMEINAHPESMVLLVQKEVADRIIMRDGKQSLMSLGVKTLSKKVKYMETVPKRWFKPQPKVDSAIIHIEGIGKNKIEEKGITIKQFFTVAKAGFAHKRKVLLGNLAHIKEKEYLLRVWEKLGIDPSARAEDLDENMWIKIAEEVV